MFIVYFVIDSVWKLLDTTSYSHFFSSTWRMLNILLVVTLFVEVYSDAPDDLETRILDRIWYVVGSCDIPLLFLLFSLITVFIRKWNCKFLPLLWQFFVVRTIINKCVHIRTYCITSCFDQFCRNFINTRRFISLQLFSSIVNVKRNWVEIRLSHMHAFSSWQSNSTVCSKYCGNL